MSGFLGRSAFSSSDGYGSGGSGGSGSGADHGGLSGLGDDDHPQYLIISSTRVVGSPTSGLEKTDNSTGDVFTIKNAGTGAALFIQQTGDVSTADAALDIDNTNSVGRGLGIFSASDNPLLPLVQFSATNSDFNEPILLITHNDPRGIGIQVMGDAYVSGQIAGPEAITFTNREENPIQLGDAGIYVEGEPGIFYFVDRAGRRYTFCEDCGDGSSGTVDGYNGFIEVDELSITGANPGTVANSTGSASSGSLTRRELNNFLIGPGFINIKGLTLRSHVDDVLYPTITYDIYKNNVLIKDDAVATVSEVFNGARKEPYVTFATGALDLSDPTFLPVGAGDGYFEFVFSADHTSDTKTIIIERRTQGPQILAIEYEYPICAFTGTQQTAIRNGQTYDVTVYTSTDTDAYGQAVAVKLDDGYAVEADVILTETFSGSGIWTGVATARNAQGNGFADIVAVANDVLANFNTESTSTLGDALVLFDNDFPVVETFEESLDLIYPAGQTCLKFSETVDAYMDVSDFTEILYTSPNGRFTIDSPTAYSVHKSVTWDQGSSGIEENEGGLTTVNLQIRARKSSNCSQTTRDLYVRLNDTPPRVTQVRWRRNNIGAYNLTSPTLGIGTHGVQVVFDDPLIALPEIGIYDGNKGTLSAFSGSVPGSTFTATLTVTGADTNGCTALSLIVAVNCSNKLPLAADPFDNTDDIYCIDTLNPEIISVQIDVDLIDGYLNDGYSDGYTNLNVMDDDADNSDNTAQACELNFSSGVQTITANNILTRHGNNVYTTVIMNAPIESGDTCVFDASPWGASSSLSVSQLDPFVYQSPFVTALGSTRNDDQGRAIGRASIFHATGGNATVADLATNSDIAANVDVLSANGVDDIASYISFTSNGTSGGIFSVSDVSFKAFVIGKTIRIVSDNQAGILRTVINAELDSGSGVITVDGGSLAAYTTAQNARAVPLSATDAEIAAWDTSKGLVAYVNDSAFTHTTVCDFSMPEAFSQHLTDAQLTENNTGTVGVDLFRANFWGSKISVPNTNGGTEANPTAAASSKYVWRSKRLRLTTNPTGVQGSTIRFMLFGFTAGTSYRNVSITATSDWDVAASKFNLTDSDSQIEIRISVDDPYAAGVEPRTNANWFKTTDFQVSAQAGFKFGKTKDINTVFSSPSTDVIDKDIYVEITLTTNVSGKAPQVDLFAFAYLT